MFEQLQQLPNFHTRLSETVAWCLTKSLDSNPWETADLRARRTIAGKAAKLSQRAFLSEGPWFWKHFLRWQSSRLFSLARLGEIAPLSQQLRSPFLRPDPFVCPQSPANRAQIVEILAEKRATQLRLDHRYPADSLDDLAGGRLLQYSPDENLCDGAAQYSSKGFFDVDNVPPWDTWVCFVESYLVSWVPPQLMELASIGIQVNPEQCILWVPDALA
jgi:hypothetical protein